MVHTAKNIVADVFSRLFLLTFPNKWSVLIAGRLNNQFETLQANGAKLRLLANSDLLLYRARTFHDKEPETNKWIASIPRDGVFYDVGANVGVFTLLAATQCRKVLAFEPTAVNYSVLNQNLLANKLDQIATAYCLAINDKSGFDTMRLSSGAIGSAHHTFGVNRDACHSEFKPVFEQGCFGVSLDDLVYVYGFECPTYLKIDVDGNEHLVVKGASQVLKDPRLKSILIELNKDLQIDRDLIETIKSCGFQLTEQGEEAMLNGMRIGNLIFFRH